MALDSGAAVGAVGPSSSLGRHYTGFETTRLVTSTTTRADYAARGVSQMGRSFASGIGGQDMAAQSNNTAANPKAAFKEAVNAAQNADPAKSAKSPIITPAAYVTGESPMNAYQQALLNTIAGPESAGRYNVIYGGDTFSSFADHPRQLVPIASGPNAGKKSSAAGKYQFIQGTWDHYKNKLGLQDFSPASQDAAAWTLAHDTFKAKTGKDLQQVLSTGSAADIRNVGKILAPIWTSLPGGIEQTLGSNEFATKFAENLRHSRSPQSTTGDVRDAVAGLTERASEAASSLQLSAAQRIETRLMRGLDGRSTGA